MHTTAALAINDWTSELALTGDNWSPGQPRERVAVIPDARTTSRYKVELKAEADRLLADRGYIRTSDWTYDGRRDAYVATIAVEEQP